MKYLSVFLIFLLFSCAKSEVIVDTTETESGTLAPIDIRAPAFFWLIQPWKEGKLATIDGRGRFAEISFVGANQMRINHLVDFPRTQLDRELITWPEAGLMASRTADRMHHLAAIDDGKTKSHIPMLTWRHTISSPVLFDADEGLVSYAYSPRDDGYETLFLYNYKEDKMVYETSEESTVWPLIATDGQCVLSLQDVFINGRIVEKTVFYNWRTNEILENDLTKVIDQHRVDPLVNPCRNIHLGGRYLFGYSNNMRQRVKVSWDEEYSDVIVTPLSYLVPNGKGVDDFILSADGKWGSTLVSGYRGLNYERLYKRAFFHLDGRYPNGISMPVITEDYEDYKYDYSAFVNHPVHGLCYAQEWHKNESGRDRLYLRLYKMDDVLAEINRQLQSEAQ